MNEYVIPDSHTGDVFDRSPLRLALLLLAGVHAAAAAVVFVPAAIDAFELPKAVVGYAFGAAELVLVLASLLIFGPGIWPRSKLHYAVFGLILWYAVATFFAVDRFVALYGERQRDLGLLAALAGLALYVALGVAVRRPVDLAIPGGLVVVAFGFVVSYEVLQFLDLDPVGWARGPKRVFSTFGTPNVLGHYLAVAFAAFLGAAVLLPTASRVLRILLTVGALLCLPLAWMTGSRDVVPGWLAAIAMMTMLVIAAERKALLRLLLLAAPAVALGLTVLVVENPLQERLGLDVRERELIYQSALDVIERTPVFGVGPDNFGAVYGSVRQPGATVLGPSSWQTSAHSWLLQLGVNAGVPAMVLGLAAVLGLTALAWRGDPSVWRASTLRLAAVAMWAFLGSGIFNIDSSGTAWLWWSLLGISVGLSARRRSLADATDRPLAWIAVPAAAAVLVAFLLVGATGAIRAAELAAVADRFWSEDPAAAVRIAEKAVLVDPGRAQYWAVLGTALEAKGNLPGAADAFREAADRSPYIGSYWSALARVTSALPAEASRKEALAAAQRGVDVDPNNPEVQFQLALIAYGLRDYHLALAAARRALQLQADYRYERIAIAAKKAIENPEPD